MNDVGLHWIIDNCYILYSEYKEIPCRNQERYIQMSEAQEEKIREELILLLSRNTHSKHILERLYKRYMKCIANEKFEAKENKFVTTMDPDDFLKKKDKNLVQNSKIELMNTEIIGKKNNIGRNIFYNIN